MTDYGYSRTSTGGQDGEGQMFRLTEAGIPKDRVFFDRGVSGMKASRPQLDRLLSVVQPGDTIYTPTLSRLGRSTQHVLSLVEDLEKRGVGLVILDLGIDTTTPIGRLTVTVLSAVNRMTRDLLAESTRDALQARKAAGVKLGAPAKLSAGQITAAGKMRAAGMSVPDIAETFGVSVATAYRALSRAQQEPAA